MQLKTIGRGRGGHSCKPNPYLSWLTSIKALKLVKAVAGLEKVIPVSASNLQATPGNMEYPKYYPPGVQVCDDALAKVSFVYSTLSAKM